VASSVFEPQADSDRAAPATAAARMILRMCVSLEQRVDHARHAPLAWRAVRKAYRRSRLHAPNKRLAQRMQALLASWLPFVVFWRMVSGFPALPPALGKPRCPGFSRARQGPMVGHGKKAASLSGRRFGLYFSRISPAAAVNESGRHAGGGGVWLYHHAVETGRRSAQGRWSPRIWR
jgi:hypothetical protein